MNDNELISVLYFAQVALLSSAKVLANYSDFSQMPTRSAPSEREMFIYFLAK